MVNRRRILGLLGLILALLGPAARAEVVGEAQRQEARRHYRAGEDQMRTESFEAAAAEFRLATRLDPLFDLAHYSLGQAYMALKRYGEAAEAYLACREAIRQRASLDHKDWAALERQRDDELRELQETVQAVRSGVIKTTSRDNMILRLEERIRVLEESRMRGSQGRFEIPAEVSMALGSAYFRQGLLSDAEEAWREAIKGNPKLGAAHNNLAVVCLKTGRLTEAEEELRRAEKAGFSVNPRLKDDLKKAREAAPVPR
jgi:tetratricopeptide (TPR) repeat protein